jgi:hypothetical protein
MLDRMTRRSLILISVAVLTAISCSNVLAVPSFERQTGMSCNVCHTVYPELTPFGRSFKLGGYVLTKQGKGYIPPVAAMVQASFTEQKNLRNRIDPFADLPDAKTNLPQQASLFYGGKIVDRLGAFVQFTYDGVGNTAFLDNTDIRYAYNSKLAGRNLLLGLTLNNNPGVQDVWNTVPAWGFPSASSAVARTPAASTLIDGGLAQQVGGIGAYAFWNHLVYAEASVYRTNRTGITRSLGAGTIQNTVVDGAMPYWRVAVQRQWNRHSLSVGTFGLAADVYSGGMASGPTDRSIDTAFDTQYQFVSKKHVFSAQTVWIHEKQILDGTFAQGGSANRSNYLNTLKLNGNYYYRGGYGTIGGTAAYFTTAGSRDEGLYSPDEFLGSRTGRPNSNGFIFELAYLPWQKVKFAAQYTFFTKFNGAQSNYDGFGRDASDNNVFYLLAWLAI